MKAGSPGGQVCPHVPFRKQKAGKMNRIRLGTFSTVERSDNPITIKRLLKNRTHICPRGSKNAVFTRGKTGPVMRGHGSFPGNGKSSKLVYELQGQSLK